jgi:undecaprenyl-diphosphatase
MFEAIILGILQGLTEFIPISSSAHLIILRWAFEWNGLTNSLSFYVALHFGTLIALLTYFRKDWIALFKTANKKDSLLWHIFIASIPAAAAGLLFHEKIDQARNSSFIPILIFFTLSLVAVLMILAERAKKGKQGFGIDKISRKDALIIGIAQAFALVPGVSRSGITIIAGLMRGCKRHEAARFSFLLGTPAVAGASMLEAKNLVSSGDIEFNILIAGIAASTITGYIVIKYLLRFLQNHTLKPFAYYRFLLAFVIIITVWTRANG